MDLIFLILFRIIIIIIIIIIIPGPNMLYFVEIMPRLNTINYVPISECWHTIFPQGNHFSTEYTHIHYNSYVGHDFNGKLSVQSDIAEWPESLAIESHSFSLNCCLISI